MESAKKSNKIREIVRLQQILKKWKKIAATNNTSRPPLETTTTSSGTKTKNISPTKFLKKTLSFSSDSNGNINSGTTSMSISSSNTNSSLQAGDVVPKGYLAVCVGREEDEMKRFVIPTEYLGHQAFGILLREAEEEFGFQQEGILKIPCDVPVFQNILKMMQHSSSSSNNTITSSTSTKRSSSAASSFFLHDHQEKNMVNVNSSCCSAYSPPPPPDSELNPSTPRSSPHLQLCR